MFLESFKTTFNAIAQLVLLGGVGYFFVRRKVVSDEGLQSLSRLVIGLCLPLFMFTEIVARFSFSLYPDWWIFPLYSVLITAVGFACGLFALGLDKSLKKNQEEFLGITTFQNSGYLPLPLVAALLAPEAAQEMFIYIFLFLLGFNMTIFSFGVVLLSQAKGRRPDVRSLFSAPVVGTLAALACVFLKVQAFLPDVLIRPAEIFGRCTIPLSIFVVGGNLASLKTGGVSRLKPIGWALAIKLVVLPLLFLGFVMLVKPKPLVGLLIVLQAAMPPAALLSVISKERNSGDHLISPSIFYGHLLSILTVPLFLALFWLLIGK
jgi:predicted permease